MKTVTYKCDRCGKTIASDYETFDVTLTHMTQGENSPVSFTGHWCEECVILNTHSHTSPDHRHTSPPATALQGEDT